MRDVSKQIRYIKEKTSASQLKQFSRCPYAFKLRYIDRRIRIHPMPELFTVGKVLHNTIEHYYLVRPEFEEIDNTLKSTFSRMWNFNDDINQYKQAVTCLRHFTHFEILRRKQYDRFPESETDITKYGYRGIVDYNDREVNLLMDFKSGERTSTSSYKYQATIYDIITDGKGDVFFYFLYPNVIRKFKVTDKHKKEVADLKQEILNAVETNTFPHTDRCKFCEFSYCCEYGRSTTIMI